MQQPVQEYLSRLRTTTTAAIPGPGFSEVQVYGWTGRIEESEGCCRTLLSGMSKRYVACL
jgi:hypothetical protein